MRKGIVITLVVIAVLIIGGFLLLFSTNQGQTETISNNNGILPGEGNTAESGTSAGSESLNPTAENPNEQTQETPKTYNIEISDFTFKPSPLNIKVGDTITWTNQDSMAHTVTSDSGSELNSQLLSKGGSYSHTFTTIGTYSYHCKPHPYMKGTIVVG